MARGQPFSVRLDEETERYVVAETLRTNRSKSAVVEALTEEAVRTRRFPGIAFRGDDASRRPWIIAAGLDVWEVCQMIEDYESSESLLEETHLSAAQLRLAKAYRRSYPAEIEQAIAENRRPPEEHLTLYPFIEFVED